MPRFCAAGAGGVRTAETCANAAAKLRPTTITRRRYIAASAILPLLELELIQTQMAQKQMLRTEVNVLLLRAS
jgi:hypothetical protein